MNLSVSKAAKQPKRATWSKERLVQERSLALSAALDHATHASYSSALNAYITFCETHNLPLDPTPDTLSFFTVYMSKHIEPRSVDSYLSGVVSQLEIYFPHAREARKSLLVAKTLKGCKRLYSNPVKRKLPLTVTFLSNACLSISEKSSFDDYLFTSLLLTGFHGLFRLGELVLPDTKKLQNWRKVTKRYSVFFVDGGFGFELPAHKADPTFEGNKPIIRRHPAFPEEVDPLHIFKTYLRKRDHLFPLFSSLWVTAEGQPPTRSWFMSRFRTLCPSLTFGGHSLRAGGATALAEVGVAPHLIQTAGRWSSDAFQIYIRKNPVLMHCFLQSQKSQT